MSDDLDEAVVPDRLEAMPLTPQQVRATTCSVARRSGVAASTRTRSRCPRPGGRGPARRDRSEAHTRANAERHKNALRAWSVEHAQSRGLGWAPTHARPGRAWRRST